MTALDDFGCHFYPAEKCPQGAAECRKQKYCPRQHVMLPEVVTSNERTYAPGDWLETDGRLAVAIETPQVFVLYEDGTTAHVPLHFTGRTAREPKITVADLQRARRELKAWLARPGHETSAECQYEKHTGMPCPRCAPQTSAALNPLLAFTHWSKDPLIPYAGCDCRSCEGARATLKTTTGLADGEPV